MDQQTRRTFLKAAIIGGGAAAGMATGPWVLRAGAQGGPVKIGVVLPYSGVYAELGEQHHPGAWSWSSRGRTGRSPAARSR